MLAIFQQNYPKTSLETFWSNYRLSISTGLGHTPFPLPGLLPDVSGSGSRLLTPVCCCCRFPFPPTRADAQVHMLPESSDTLQDAWGDVVPWGGVICAFGFLLVNYRARVDNLRK